jgi:protein-disulfide isomerase
VDKTEIDAVSVDIEKKRFAVAEVKVSRQLDDACRQVAERVEKLMDLNILKRSFEFIKEPYKPSEAAIVTLYRLQDEYKRELKSKLEAALEGAGVDRGCAAIYDIQEILESINKWGSKGKDRYRELFETLNKILEAT